MICPCGSHQAFLECCSPIISGMPAPSAEALVRSRFTAFAVRQLDHVEKTHAPEVRADFNRAEAERLAEDCEWQALTIHKTVAEEDTAEIEFVVQIRHQERVIRKGACSKFRRDNGEWLFVSSKPLQHLAHQRNLKIGRNDPCHCGSGKKFKKCCEGAELGMR